MVSKLLDRWRGGGVAIVLIGSFLLALLTSGTLLSAHEEAKPTALPADLARIPSEGMLPQSVRVADLWESEIGKAVRQKLGKNIGEAAQTFEKFFGLSLERVGRLTISATPTIDVITVCVVVLEAVQKAIRTQSFNNLKQIALAMYNFENVYQHFPPHATYDKNGKSLLSWRVLILPYLGEDKLYKQFHLNEPWDSEHNKKLLARMPKVYASPQDKNTLKDHTTHYQGFFGEGTFFENTKKLRVTDITDGTSNTLMIVEASKAVPWTKPEDLPYDVAKPLPKLGLPRAKGFRAALCDGSVRYIANTVKPMILRGLITYNGGEVINDPDF